MKPKIENKHHIKETKTAWWKGASQSAPKFPICQNDDTNQSLTKVFGSRNSTTPKILCLLEATFFLFPNWQQAVEQILSKFLVSVPGGNEVARDAWDASAVLSHLFRSSCVHTLWTLSSCQTVSVSHEHLCVLTSLSYSYRVVFLTVPPKFHAKKKSVVQLTRIFCTSRISWNRIFDWLLIL